VAVAGALVGAFVGFTCGTAALAILTTLVGAIAGTNLALIACDMVAEARRRRREASEPTVSSEVARELVLPGAGA
jgi:outer membrane lipoprotein SlyB